jgi:hypothetical protein
MPSRVRTSPPVAIVSTIPLTAFSSAPGKGARTLFGYVETKKELRLMHPMLWLEVFDTTIEEKLQEPFR